ncbi:hypothetical protein HRI_004501700 [Hibiscus trionum]|uniref:Uncharacterized protein n=1 Tax=Hibiscus trionum TaxID=183268 RepID=A0A9W7J6M8_HIBTR|nr:hypothetical protein HRI_004501700 [Hibiscus trionum]
MSRQLLFLSIHLFVVLKILCYVVGLEFLVTQESRLKLGSYVSSFRVNLGLSVLIPERSHIKIQVCFHRNASLGLCKCGDGDWKASQNGVWYTVMSPYDHRYIDVNSS